MATASMKQKFIFYRTAMSILLSLQHNQCKTAMPNKKIKGSLCEIVEKMNKKYDGLIGEGFNLGLDRRIVPVIVDDMVTGWKMQRCEDGVWTDMDEAPFTSMKALIKHYKD